MADPIEYSNPNHIQATKISDKCTAAYPILMLPLRLEARFMHIEPDTTVIDVEPSIYTMTEIGRQSNDNLRLSGMGNIENLITNLADKSSHVPETVELEGLRALTAWKYAAISEVLVLNSKDWIPNYRSQINEITAVVTTIENRAAGLSVQVGEEAPLLSTTQKEEIGIHAQQLIQAIATGDPIATTKGDYFFQVTQQLLQQVEQFITVAQVYQEVHSEDELLITTTINSVKDTIIAWHAQVQNHLDYFETKANALEGQLQEVQSKLDSGYQQLKKESAFAGELPVWKKLSSLHRLLAQYQDSLKLQEYNALLALASSIEGKVQTLSSSASNLEEYALFILAHTLMLEVEVEQLYLATSQQMTAQKNGLLHYHTTTEQLIKEVDRAIEQLKIEPEVEGEIQDKLLLVKAMEQSFTLVPAILSDWSGAQIGLNTQLHELVISLLQIAVAGEENQQLLLNQWNLAKEQYAVWKDVVAATANSLESDSNAISTALSAAQQSLLELADNNFREQAALPEAEVWKAGHHLRLYTDRLRKQPLWEIDKQWNELNVISQLMNTASDRLKGIEKRSARVNFALSDNLGRTAAVSTQIATFHQSAIQVLTQEQQQLQQHINLVNASKESIIIQEEEAIDSYAEIAPLLAYLQKYTTTITNQPAPIQQLDLLLYDYWELQRILEIVAELLGRVTSLSEQDNSELNVQVSEILQAVQGRISIVNSWQNTLNNQTPELEAQEAAVKNLIQQQFDTYLGEEEENSLFLVQRQAAELEHLTTLLTRVVSSNLDSASLKSALEAAALTLNNSTASDSAVAPAYKKRISAVLSETKKAVEQSSQFQQERLKRFQLLTIVVEQAYQTLDNTVTYLNLQAEGEPLNPTTQQELEQLVNHLTTALQQSTVLINNTSAAWRYRSTISELFKQISAAFQALEDQSVAIESQTVITNLITPVRQAYTTWREGVDLKQNLLTTQLQATEEQAVRIHTALQNGQTGTAAMATNGSHSGSYKDRDIICWLPIGGSGGNTGGGGTSGGGNTGGTTDPTNVSNYELWIRAYPDDIAINNHEKRLTDNEIQDAIIYWTAIWNAAGNTAIELGAWRVLVGKYGAERAAWLARQLTPTNISERPKAVTVSTTTIEDVATMRVEDVSQIGGAFWNNLSITQNSPEEQTGVVNNFRATYANTKAEVLAYLTQPTQLGENLYQSTYQPAPSGGVINLVATSTQIQQRTQQLTQYQQVAMLNNPTPQFPVLTPDDRREATWSMAAYTDVMPDQLAFLLYNWEGEVVHEKLGALIPKKLQIGIDPKDETQFDPAQSDLGIKPNTIKWMTDFEEAVSKGMAIKIPITTEEGAAATNASTIEAGFSRMYVLGVKHYDRENTNTVVGNIQVEGQQQIEELLEAHHYTHGGLAILSPGTPTNNTSDQTSDFSFLSKRVKETYQTEIQQQLSANKDSERPEDGHILAEALGIDSSVFKHIKNNKNYSSHNAALINKALWMSTWGLYLEEMFGHKDGFFQSEDFLPSDLNNQHNWLHYFNIPEDLDKVYNFFTKHVKGRGELPALRVGKQPYGILTTGVLQDNTQGWKWQDAPINGTQNELSQEFLEHFKTLLLSYLWGYKSNNATASKKWLRVVEEHIRTVDDAPLGAGSSVLTGLQEQFMKILRLHPTAASYYARYALNPYSMIASSSPILQNGVYQGLFRGSNVSLLNNWTQFSSSLENEFKQFIEYYDANNTSTAAVSNTTINDLRLFETYGNGSTETLQPLTGAVVDTDNAGSEKNKLTPIDGTTINYIQWLATTSPEEIINRTQQIDQDFVQGGEPSSALLYLSLRNALLNQYWDAAMRILEQEQFRDFTHKEVVYNNKTGWGASMDYHATYNVHKPHTGLDAGSNEYYSELLRSNSFSAKFYHYGYLQRNSYKVFVKDVNLPTAKETPEYGDELITSGGRLPFLLEINTDDVPNISASNLTMAAYLFPGIGVAPINALADYPQETAALKTLLDALKVLADQPVAELERLYAEHMDLASHRLDAWILGMANKRLAKIRAVNKTGTYLGSYGWLMNIKPGGQRTDVNDNSILYTIDRRGEAPVMQDPDNQGYIQAPSLNHAMTAAVLRSGYEAHKGTADENLLAVNLSSERVKRALFYIEGIRNGQHLGALLGYRLERQLREANLGQYTLALREQYPIQQLNYEDNNQQPLLPTSPSSVINGLAVVEQLRDMQQTGETFATAFNYINVNDQSDVATIMDKIVEDMDALADLSLAEGTYQMVLGNYSRSNAMMHALSKGAPIPEPEIVKTPRSGQTLTHRVGMTLATVNTAMTNPIWASNFTPRALVEPALNAKLGELFPAPAQVQCQVTYQRKNNNNAAIEEVVNLSLADLQIEPIDLLYIFPESIKDTHSELAKRFQQTAYSDAVQFSTDAFYGFQVNFELGGATAYTIADIAPLVAQLQLLFSNSRYLQAKDLVHPTTDTTNLELTGVNSNSLQELASRASNLRNSLEQAANNLSMSANSSNIWDLANYGINEAALATPKTDSSANNLDYTNSIQLVKKMAVDRLAQYDKIINPVFNDPTIKIKDKIELYQKAVSSLLGKSFLLLPQIVPLNTTELGNAYNDKGAILPTNDPMGVERWTAGLARVRHQVNRLENVSFLQGMLLDYTTESLSWEPIQLPYRANDHWVGLELPEDYYQNHFTDTDLVSLDKLSLVMDWHTAPNTTPFVGLLLDEWTEKIPLAEEIAGLAFHYDQPNSKAPQSILLAVHPENSDVSSSWQWHQLVNTLDTTLELAKMRAVEPDHLQTQTDPTSTTDGFDAFSQLLPATFALVDAPNSEENWSTDYHKNTNTHLHKTN